MKKPAFLILAAIFLSALASFGEQILVAEPMTYGVSKSDLETLDALIDGAVVLANGLYADYFEVTRQGSRPDYTLKIVPIFDPHNPMMAVTMSRGRTDSSPVAISGEIGEKQVRYLANAVFYLWSSFHDYLRERVAEPPVFIAEIPVSSISQTVMDNPTMYLAPQDVSVKKNSNVVIAMSTIAVETDPYFRIVGDYGKSLLESGNYTAAGGVAVTPADTVFLKPYQGRDLFYFPAGIEQPIKWRPGIDVASAAFTALNDGSVVIYNAQQKQAIRLIGQKKEALDLVTSPYSYVYSIAAGPEGNIWAYDIQERRLKVHSVKGEIIDSIMPLLDQMEGVTPLSMDVFDDGSFVTYSSGLGGGMLHCFRRDGSLRWKMDSIPGDLPEPLPTTAKVAVDGKKGLIYLTDMMGQRIIQLLDVSYAKDMGLRDEYIDRIVALNARLMRDDGDRDAAAEIAEIYESLGAFEMAQILWERVLQIDPFDGEANERLDALEVSLLRTKADRLRDKTLDLLERLGPVSAQQSYTQALQLYEQVLSIAPDDETRKEMEELKRKFQEKSAPAAPGNPLTIVDVVVEDLFPSLMQYYHRNPIGTVKIKNSLQETVADVEAYLMIRRYVDFPVVTEMDGKLEAGKEATLDLSVLFNEEIFSLQEDLPIQAEAVVSYSVGGSEQKVSKNVSLTLFRRTALTWDDSGKIASFVVPNEEIVSRFSHRVAATGGIEDQYRIAEKFFRGMKICDAVGMYGIHYIEDPEAPISRILGEVSFIDTVRFPRTTLLLKSGDCDDTTALLCSLLESSGIKTAIMTSPGHVFMAMDTGEPAENLWLFQTDELEAIAHAGRVWLPIETTALDKGFYASWAIGSDIYRRHSKDRKIEFLPVEELRMTYPALPLPKSNFTIVEPTDDLISPVFLASVAQVSDALYRSSLDELRSRRAQVSGNKELQIRNQIAVLHARFGRDREAEEEFRSCIQSDPDFLSSYLNMANLMLSQEEPKKAISVLKEGLAREPDSVLLNLLLGRAYLSDGSQNLALKHYEKVKELSPRTAERYAVLFGRDASGAQRASNPTADFPLIWESGE